MQFLRPAQTHSSQALFRLRKTNYEKQTLNPVGEVNLVLDLPGFRKETNVPNKILFRVRVCLTWQNRPVLYFLYVLSLGLLKLE